MIRRHSVTTVAIATAVALSLLGGCVSATDAAPELDEDSEAVGGGSTGAGGAGAAGGEQVQFHEGTGAGGANRPVDNIIPNGDFEQGNEPLASFYANRELLGARTAEGVGRWVGLSTAWYSGSATTVTLERVNANTALVGNDFAVDDVFLGTESTVPLPNRVIVRRMPYCRLLSELQALASSAA